MYTQPMIRKSFLVLVAALIALTACERESISTDPVDTIPPIPPAGLRVEKAQDGYITISWLIGGEPDLYRFVIYRSESEAGPFAAIDSTLYDFYIDEQRTYETTYYYYVTALDESGNESDPSHTVSSTSPNLTAPKTPDPPTILSVKTNGTRIMRLSWIPEDDSDLDGYAVYRSDTEVFEADSSTRIGFTNETFFDDAEALELGTVYYYRIRAIDNGGLTSEATDAVWQVHLAVPVLLSPSQLASVPQIPEFTWEPVPHAAEYELQVLETPDDVYAVVIHVDAPEEPLNLRVQYFGPTLQKGRVYYWRVVTFSKKREYPNSSSETRAFIVN